MTTEDFSTRERIETMTAYGSGSDEVCYAARRLKKIGAVPFSYFNGEDAKDVYKKATDMAKESNQMVAVYLNFWEVEGLLLITPGHPNSDEIIWSDVKEMAAKDRWDKPIEEQKKEEPFDRFQIYEYGKKLYEKWGVTSKEGQYAAERLEKLGIKPYDGRMNGNVSDIFWNAMKQAKANNNQVALHLNSGVIKGLFVVAPENMADDKEFATQRFNQYVKNQQNLRYDKPIAVQIAEEKQLKGKENARK